MDKFPEAFRRFEEVVDARRIRSFRQLLVAFSLWSGEKWRSSPAQMKSLILQSQESGVPVPLEILRRYDVRPRRIVPSPPPPMVRVTMKTLTWRREVITVKGKVQQRYRDLGSGRFISKPKETSA